MKILFDIGHPAHVHLFKNLAWQLEGHGHQVYFSTREKDVTTALLKAYDIKYISFGKNYSRAWKKPIGLVKFTYLLLKYARKIKPDMYVSHGSFYAAIVSKLLKKPHVSLENNGNWEQIRLYLPFTDVVFTPWNLEQDLGNKQVRLKTFHEMAYLRPEYFKPDKGRIEKLGIQDSEKYCIIRLVSWNASHDVGQTGINKQILEKIVRKIEKDYRIFISAEGDIPEEFRKYLIKIDPVDMHHVLYYASLCISEGATMASEAGALGTPALYVNTLKRSYNKDQETFGTVFNCNRPFQAIDALTALLSTDLSDEIFQERRKELLRSRIDLTQFLLWFIEDYPNSLELMSNYPDYQLKFR